MRGSVPIPKFAAFEEPRFELRIGRTLANIISSGFGSEVRIRCSGGANDAASKPPTLASPSQRIGNACQIWSLISVASRARHDLRRVGSLLAATTSRKIQTSPSVK